MLKIKSFKIKEIEITDIVRGIYWEGNYIYNFSLNGEQRRFSAEAKNVNILKKILNKAYSNLERARDGKDLEVIKIN